MDFLAQEILERHGNVIIVGVSGRKHLREVYGKTP
nr:MAG TPA: hypothetical protein [Caudoviricetes sp.]